jgi:hypothetical protein
VYLALASAKHLMANGLRHVRFVALGASLIVALVVALIENFELSREFARCFAEPMER